MIFKFYIGVSLLLAACSRDTKPRYIHEPERGSLMATPKGTPSISTSVEGVNLEKLRKNFDRVVRGEMDAYEGLVAPLEGIFLNEQVVGSPRNHGSKEFLELLRLWNEGLLRMWKSKRHQEKSRQLFQQQGKLLLAGCDVELKGCRNLVFYSRDPNSKEIVKKLAHEVSEKDLEIYYLYLKIAFDLQKERGDGELELMYLQKARAYVEELYQKGRDLKKLEKHWRVVKHLFSDEQRMRQTGEFFSFVRSFPFFGMTKQQENYSLLREIFDWVVDKPEYLYEPTGQLIKELRQTIQEMDRDGGRESYVKGLELIKNYPVILKNLGVQEIPLEHRDEYYLLVSRVYREQWEQDSALKFWQGTKRDYNRLEEVVRRYVELEFVRKVIETNQQMEVFFKKREPSVEFLEKVFKKADEIGNEWTVFYRRMRLLHQLTQAIWGEGGSERFQKYIRGIEREVFESLRENVKYVVVYPQMMMVAYHMGKMKFTKNFPTMSGSKVEISASRVVRELMNGQYAPWFDYGTNAEKLNSAGMLYAYYFAVSTGLHEVFEVDASDFFRVIVEQMLMDGRLAVEGVQKSLNGYERDVDYEQFLKLCEYEKNKEKNPNLVSPKDLLQQIQFDDISEKVYLGKLYHRFFKDSHRDNSALQFFSGLRSQFGTMEDIIDILRTEVKEPLGYLQLMMNFYGQDYGKNAKEKVVNTLALSSESIKVFLTSFMERYHQMQDCYLRLANRQRELEVQLLQYEVKHLKQLHLDLRAVLGGSLKFENLKEKHRFYELDGHPYQGFDFKRGFDGKYFRYHRLDFFMRVRKYLQEGLKTSVEELPALAPYVEIVLPLPESWKSMEDYENQRGIAIEWTADENQFVHTALSEHQSLGWVYNQYGKISSFSWQLGLISALYKLGEIDLIEESSCPLEGAQKQCKDKSIKKIKKIQIQPEELLDKVYEIKNFFHINNQERDFLNIWDQQRKHAPGEYFFYNLKTDQLMGFYDIPYILVTNPLLGYFKNLPWETQDLETARETVQERARTRAQLLIPNRLSSLDRARHYYITKKYQKPFLFPLQSTMDTLLDRFYRKKVETEQNQIYRLERAMERDVKNHSKERYLLRLKKDEQPVILPVIRSILIETQRAREKQFNQETGNYFATEMKFN